ncbi:MAG TPA: 3-methyl-2-oxobutanoate dehydrogenase subunit VorB [bacterium]|uniref:Pyruvate synthase subunit PorA n=1 Tax=candidate division TA06 bacterium ADurb.Bin417 TaxID=1852828 RepID=A0A1V5MK12_UNCT6|nr:MAG: Pyruvate synthase subunit PorA [candidate division TA06 bacterium ADurb.Bin417]HNQ34624.1 3-methyl-2-oxobutanoate dehydrogenase subunit VorB [bacterium]HNS48086.1 3-methyl-2-oxobutanoate dehydrogenase subunit VorB [bacterium]
MSGNEVAGEAAVAAGCRFYAGYPITPQNQLTEYMSRRVPEVGGVFIQAESELAAINMVFGAAAAGARAMTSSSSPGISLKQEGISYLAGCELPAVIVNMNRAGPGLGDVTPSQADYFQSTRGGGHGDYRTITLGPQNLQELYDLTYLAFELADRYRNPALILGDGILAQVMEPVRLKPLRRVRPAPAWALTGCGDGPPRKILSLFLKPGVAEAHNWRLAAKYRRIEVREQRWDEFQVEDAKLVVAAFGSSARIARASVQAAREEGLAVGLFRPVSLWPFPYQPLRRLAEGRRRFLVVEMNLGQMVEDVRLAVENRGPVSFYGRPGGGVPTPEEILKVIRKTYRGAER